MIPASWSSDNAFLSVAVDPRFKSQAGQIDSVLPTARHSCDISSKKAVLLWLNDTETGSANLLQAWAYYSEYTMKDMI